MSWGRFLIAALMVSIAACGFFFTSPAFNYGRQITFVSRHSNSIEELARILACTENTSKFNDYVRVKGVADEFESIGVVFKSLTVGSKTICLAVFGAGFDEVVIYDVNRRCWYFHSALTLQERCKDPDFEGLQQLQLSRS